MLTAYANSLFIILTLNYIFIHQYCPSLLKTKSRDSLILVFVHCVYLVMSRYLHQVIPGKSSWNSVAPALLRELTLINSVLLGSLCRAVILLHDVPGLESEVSSDKSASSGLNWAGVD